MLEQGKTYEVAMRSKGDGSAGYIRLQEGTLAVVLDGSTSSAYAVSTMDYTAQADSDLRVIVPIGSAGGATLDWVTIREKNTVSTNDKYERLVSRDNDFLSWEGWLMLPWAITSVYLPVM